MRILVASYSFPPASGGIETVSNILAHEFASRGHQVIVATHTPGESRSSGSFAIHRQPSSLSLLKLVKWCDVLFHNNISLKMLWPATFVRRPLVIAHHTWLRRTNGEIGFQDRVKQIITRYARNITISKPMAAHLAGSAVIVGNPYDDEIFRNISGIPRDHDLVFLGRLVRDKGIDLLIRSLALLRSSKLTPDLTIVGAGPEETSLRALAYELNVSNQITFLGDLPHSEVAKVLNQHRIMVVPSRWQEPFGIVALEGIACGCVVVGSSGGGLRDAIGPCGVTFPNGNVHALSKALQILLQEPALRNRYLSYAKIHLSTFTKSKVADAYLKVLEEAHLCY